MPNRTPRRRLPAGISLGGLLLCFLAPIHGLSQGETEMSSRESTAATFKSRVNLVIVPVVVRDAQGRAVGNLRKEDFQLFDKGKMQVISKFSVEKSGAQAARDAGAGAAKGDEKPPGEATPPAMPDRYTAYLFDDVHADVGDLARARDAAIRHLDALDSTERAAIYSTSGQTNLEFTDDRAKLKETLLRLQPRPAARGIRGMECPDISYYQADLIQNKNDQMALQVGTQDAMNCLHLDQTMISAAQQAARSAASAALSAGDHESRLVLSVLTNVIRRIAAMPGQRSIVLVSPGFFTPYDLYENKTEIIERAIHANVIISGLDARGLYTLIPGGDASQAGYSANIIAQKSRYDMDSAMMQSDVLAELAEGTGGSFFHNNNDLDAGFRRVGTAPEYVYMLGFSPENLKLDGSFHKLKVALTDKSKMGLQARRGYYAPRHPNDPAETAKQEIADALFSREEMHDIPVELHTQYFKASEDSAHVAVLVRLDVRHMHFKKLDGRNRDDVTVVSALFDRNGNYVTGSEKTLEMRLLDDTLEKRLGQGVTVRSSFDVKPGTYLVRLVVRDTEGQMMSAQNGAVEIQ
jgi:VWFA-related protein